MAPCNKHLHVENYGQRSTRHDLGCAVTSMTRLFFAIFNFFILFSSFFSLGFYFVWGWMQERRMDAKGQEMNKIKIQDVKDIE